MDESECVKGGSHGNGTPSSTTAKGEQSSKGQDKTKKKDDVPLGTIQMSPCLATN
jgi:hypothetical protein